MVLQDGMLITVEREVDYTFRVASGDSGSGFQLFKTWPDRFWIKFSHPDTKETIKWQGEQFFKPVLLDVVKGVPYLVVVGRPTKDTESTYGCPELPYIYLQYDNSGIFGKWRPIPLEQAPDALRKANLSPNYDIVMGKRHLSADDVQHNITLAEGSSARYVQREIPRSYEEWRNQHKNSYRNERRKNDCRPPRSPLPPVVLPAAIEVSLERLDSLEYPSIRVVRQDDWTQLTYDRTREEACKQMFRPADPNDYLMGERFVYDSTTTKRVPYSENSQRQMGVRQVCDDHIWFITHLEERGKMIITKFTIAGDLVYRISFYQPEKIQGMVGYIAIPSLKSEAGFLYFDWHDFQNLNQQWRIKRILQLRVQEPSSSNNEAME
ncbi:MAG: hypothetical protein OEY86_17790 [Nitrospira sp.]|nr:hypothetical protein [Nitrospira sp.]